MFPCVRSRSVVHTMENTAPPGLFTVVAPARIQERDCVPAFGAEACVRVSIATRLRIVHLQKPT